MKDKPIKLYTECGNHPAALLGSGAVFFFYAIMYFIFALILFRIYFPLSLTSILMALVMIALWAFTVLSNYVIFDGDEIRFYSGFKHKKHSRNQAFPLSNIYALLHRHAFKAENEAETIPVERFFAFTMRMILLCFTLQMTT